MKSTTKIILYFSLPLLIIFIYIKFGRTFYRLGDETITVWKTTGNKCYVIFGSYYGVSEPSSYDYIITSNDNAITLIKDIKKNPISYTVYNDFGKPILINVKRNLRVLDEKNKKEYLDEFFVNNKIDEEYQYLMIDIKED